MNSLIEISKERFRGLKSFKIEIKREK